MLRELDFNCSKHLIEIVSRSQDAQYCFEQWG